MLFVLTKILVWSYLLNLDLISENPYLLDFDIFNHLDGLRMGVFDKGIDIFGITKDFHTLTSSNVIPLTEDSSGRLPQAGLLCRSELCTRNAWCSLKNNHSFFADDILVVITMH